MTAATIWVNFTDARFHRWPQATGKREYLRSLHRHLFHIKVSTTVQHDDREIEFHDLLEMAKVEFVKMDVKDMSCEAMARALGKILAHRYGRDFIIDIAEDGECGATVVVETQKKAPPPLKAVGLLSRYFFSTQ